MSESGRNLASAVSPLWGAKPLRISLMKPPAAATLPTVSRLALLRWKWQVPLCIPEAFQEPQSGIT